MIKAALFDMDRLMINTEPLQSRAYEAILREYGKEPKRYPSGVIQKVGVREKDNWELIKAAHDLTVDTALLMEKRSSIYGDLLRQNLVPQGGLHALVELLKAHTIPMAVASSSPTHNIELVLDGLNVRAYFTAIVSGHDVPRGKPFPDIFLEAAKQLGVPAEYCIVFEDAQSGIEAGKAAGAKVIAVPNEFTADHDISLADKVVSSLSDIDWPMITSLWTA